MRCAWSYGALLCICGVRCALCAAYGAQLCIYGAGFVLCSTYRALLCIYGVGFVLCMELWGTAVRLWGAVCAVQRL